MSMTGGLEFTHKRLVNHDGKLFWWAIAAEDGQWYVMESWDHQDSWVVNCCEVTELDCFRFIEAWCADYIQ